jgi:hypothetical protein
MGGPKGPDFAPGFFYLGGFFHYSGVLGLPGRTNGR